MQLYEDMNFTFANGFDWKSGLSLYVLGRVFSTNVT
jgi:hypothetical protein